MTVWKLNSINESGISLKSFRDEIWIFLNIKITVILKIIWIMADTAKYKYQAKIIIKLTKKIKEGSRKVVLGTHIYIYIVGIRIV